MRLMDVRLRGERPDILVVVLLLLCRCLVLLLYGWYQICSVTGYRHVTRCVFSGCNWKYIEILWVDMNDNDCIVYI